METSNIIATVSAVIAAGALGHGIYKDIQSGKEKAEQDKIIEALQKEQTVALEGIRKSHDRLVAVEELLLKHDVDVTLREATSKAFIIDVAGTLNLDVKVSTLTSGLGVDAMGPFGMTYQKLCHMTTVPHSGIIKSVKCPNLIGEYELTQGRLDSWRAYQQKEVQRLNTKPEAPSYLSFSTLIKIETTKVSGKSCKIFRFDHVQNTISEYTDFRNVAGSLSKMTATGYQLLLNSDLYKDSINTYSARNNESKFKDIFEKEDEIIEEAKRSGNGMCFYNFSRFQ